MNRSLGNKRNEISDEYIGKITNIYGKFKENEYCKIFPNKYFGYTRITVERPLRLNFQTSKERIVRIEQQSGFINLAKSKKKGKTALNEIEEGKKLQKQIQEILLGMNSDIVYKNRQKFIEAIEQKANNIGINLQVPVTKSILNALSERDEAADICMDKDNKPEPDTDLRDYENVPLGDDIDGYFKREVLPHIPDAYMDRSKDKVGYEINFTKEFYKYKPLRSLEEIRKDILVLAKETEGLLEEVLR
jgi:type I restriction enzyme M protein